jgi:CHAT domain
MKFFDLRIEFRSAAEGRRTAIISGPTAIKSPHTAEVDFVLPFTLEHLQHWRDEINTRIKEDKAIPKVHRVGDPPRVRYETQQDPRAQAIALQRQVAESLDLMAALGQDLFIALFKTEGSLAYAIYGRSRQRAIRRRRGLRIRLILPPDGTLDQVPFEYLFDPWARDFLAKRTDVLTSIVRVVAVDQPKPKSTLQGHLRLWYISASPQLSAGINSINDFDIISDATMDADLKVIPFPILNASADKLTHRLSTYARHGPHILHISAHGKSGHILLQNSSGMAEPVLAEAIAAQLARSEYLGLVVFSICDMPNPIRCAMSLCRQGVAVVMMQQVISNEAVERFQTAFYAGFLNDRDLDSAVVAGRGKIAHQSTIEWGTPVVIVPAFPPVPRYVRLWHWLSSFLIARALIPRGGLIAVCLALCLILLLLVYEIQRPLPQPPAIQHIVLYTGSEKLTAPDQGQHFAVGIRGAGGTVPIEVFASAEEQQSLDFTATVLGTGTVTSTREGAREAHFEYIPTTVPTSDMIEFCAQTTDVQALRSCMTLVLDIKR